MAWPAKPGPASAWGPGPPQRQLARWPGAATARRGGPGPGAGVRILANAAGPAARAGYRASDGRSLRSGLRLLSEFRAECAAESAGLGAARIWSRGFVVQ